MQEDDKKVKKRRFEKIFNMMECKSYTENEDISENKKIFIYGFNHIKTNKIVNYILFRSESDEINENNKLFKFWSDKFLFQERENSR